MVKKIFIKFFLAIITVGLIGCAHVSVEPHLKPLAAYTNEALLKKGMKPEAPIFIRIFKEESELEVWKAKDDGRYHLFRSYPICKWSGKLGPKLRQGDKQAPEGFYKVSAGLMNPRSSYYLSFNLGYPNAYDKAHGRTGKHLMVHGDCTSAGCYAMTDALMEEIYLLMREAFNGGQKYVHVHAFPFRMTNENMRRHKSHRWINFWRMIKAGYDDFEVSRKPPKVDVCGRRYVVNAKFKNPNARLNANWPCPAYKKQPPAVFLGKPQVEMSKYKKRFTYKPETLIFSDNEGIGL